MRKQLLNLKFLLMLCMIFGIGGGSVAFAEKITDYTKIVSGKKYFIRATTSNTDYYLKVDGTNAATGKAGTAVTQETEATVFIFEGSGASWSIQFDGTSNYLSLATGKANGKVDVVTSATEFTLSNTNKGLISILKGSYSVQKNNSTINFGSYGNTQTDVWLEPIDDTPIKVSSSDLAFGNVETGTSKDLTFTLTGSNLTADASLTIDGTDKDMFSVSPLSVSQTDGTISETPITVTYTPTSTGDHTATLNIASGETTATVNLSGTGIAPLTHYSVSWKVNGADYTTGNPSTDVVEGSKVTTLPTEPESINGKVFVGWTNAELATSQDEAPSVLFTTTESAPDVTGNTTYYAVFAKQDGEGISSVELTGTEITNLGTLAYTTEKTYSRSSLGYVIYGYKSKAEYPWIQLKKDKNVYVKITAPEKITKVDLTITSATNSKDGITDISKHTAFSGTVGLVTTDCEFSGTSENIGSVSAVTDNFASITTISATKELYIKVSSGARIWGITTYYGSVQYSGYTTTVSEPATPVTGNLTLVAKDNGIYYATFSNNEPVLFTTDVEVDAVSVSGTTLKFSELTKGEYNVRTNVEGSSASVDSLYYVPANTGVLIQSVTDNVTYYYPYESQTVTLPENNLKAAPAADGVLTPEKGDYKYYKLAYDNYATQTGLGFYWGAENGGAFSVKAGTAYLAVPTSAANVKGFSFDGTTTGISAVGAEGTAKTNEIYNIAGQRVNAMTKAGLYIVNGKKMVIKK